MCLCEGCYSYSGGSHQFAPVLALVGVKAGRKVHLAGGLFRGVVVVFFRRRWRLADSYNCGMSLSFFEPGEDSKSRDPT